jgi:NADH-quinone oxidoreductase subunit C
VPDATGLELIAQDLRDAEGEPGEGGTGPVLDTIFFRGRGTLVVDAPCVRSVLARLRERGYTFLASVHAADYLPAQPRFGVLYELIDMERVDRITVKTLLAESEAELESLTPDAADGPGWPTADHQEREIYDMFGIVFRGHPDLRRILMPEDYEGHPQRRDFPVGGEPVFFTFNDRDPE